MIGSLVCGIVAGIASGYFWSNPPKPDAAAIAQAGQFRTQSPQEDRAQVKELLSAMAKGLMDSRDPDEYAKAVDLVSLEKRVERHGLHDDVIDLHRRREKPRDLGIALSVLNAHIELGITSATEVNLENRKVGQPEQILMRLAHFSSLRRLNLAGTGIDFKDPKIRHLLSNLSDRTEIVLGRGH